MYLVGSSKDIHKLVLGKKLILGGVEIPFDLGELAHSDGDVVYHAVSESILGALALGDLGTHFPDSDPSTEGMNSEVIVRYVVNKMKQAGFSINNIDIFISLERPKLKDYIAPMIKNVSSLLGCPIERVSIKAGTNEGLGPVGEGKAVEAYSTVLLVNE